jgi:FdhE protein
LTFEQGAARAEALAAASAAAREPLLFAAVLCRAQRDMTAALERLHSSAPPLTGRFADDVHRVVRLARDLLRAVCEKGPPPLAELAQSRLDDDEVVAGTRLQTYWQGDIDAREDYLSRAMVRPYAEFLRTSHITTDRIHVEGHCPFCGGAASVASRSGVAEGEGVVRRLHCSLCGNDWIFKRACCPACQESAPEKLPIYQTETHVAARIEACDTCRRYVKSIDQSLDARLIPEIDDLASIALDLWAVREGYTRIEPGLAGI